MEAGAFLKTIYLGDRGCKSIIIDGWRERVLLQVDLISRIRSCSGNWEFYTDEDIEDGFIVFTLVESISFEPSGLIPNDYIFSVTLTPIISENTKYTQERSIFQIRVGSVDKTGNSNEVLVQVVANGIHLEDPARPGIEITD